MGGGGDCAAIERGKTFQAIADQLRERSETDAEIEDMDIADLCRELGGSMSELGAVSDGSGYKKLTPNASTRCHILANDVPFARQVTAHNRQCAKDAGCP